MMNLYPAWRWLYRCEKTPCPDYVRWLGGPKQRFIVKELYVGDASLQLYGSSNWVWLRLDIKQNHWSIVKNNLVVYLPI